MKKIFSLLFFFLIMCCVASCYPQGNTSTTGGTTTEPPTDQATPADDFECEVDENNEITIAKYIGNDKNVVIPRQIDGKNVTIIGEWSFWDSNIVSVSIPHTVKVIGTGAFAFCGSLTIVQLKNGLIEIQGVAFDSCFALSNIVLPSTLEHIGLFAFRECTALKHITIPQNVNKWEQCAFERAGIETVEFEEGLEVIGDSAFIATKLKSIVLPSSIKTVSEHAFSGCLLEEITLNDGLVTIGDFAFAGNNELVEIVIPKTVTNVVESAFFECSKLKNIKFEGDAPQNYLTDIPPEFFSAPDCTLYYHAGASGFTSPEWNGLPTKIW